MVHDFPRMTGTAFTPDWFDRKVVNHSAAVQRVGSLSGRRSVKKEWQAAWLLKAITCIDLTTLAGDDTPGRVRRLCAKARRPVRDDILKALGVDNITTGAVCVYPTMVSHAVKALEGSAIPVASVATGFPTGLTPLSTRLAEITYAVEQGAREIDIVITREQVLTGQWQALFDEICSMREACGEAHLKAILATGDLQTLTNVYKASMVAMQAGADFIKTSTGKESVNATLPVSLTMLRALRDFQDHSGQIVGFKPAGGISTAKNAIAWQVLIKEEVGARWLHNDLFRIGASSLLGDIERQLEHNITGRYSASNRHAMA